MGNLIQIKTDQIQHCNLLSTEPVRTQLKATADADCDIIRWAINRRYTVEVIWLYKRARFPKTGREAHSLRFLVRQMALKATKKGIDR